MRNNIEGCGLYGAQDISINYGGIKELPNVIRTDAMGNPVMENVVDPNLPGIPTGPEGIVMSATQPVTIDNNANQISSPTNFPLLI
mgnify:CR=1 FL=1|jgi:hypothetical protein